MNLHLHAADWRQRHEGGSRFMLRFIRWLALHGSERAARALLYPVTLYYLVMRGPERRASRAYLRRVLGREVSWLHVARHIFTFATTILDRVFLLTGRFDATRVRVHGLDELKHHLAQGKGVILLGAHFGSFEAVRTVSFARDDIIVRILADHRHNNQLTSLLEALNPRVRDAVIDIGGDTTHALLRMHETLEAGGIVGILGDRVREGDASVALPLLGAPVALPTGPMRLAATLHAPVMLIFGVLNADRSYDVYFEPFADQVELGARGQREQRLQQWLMNYATRLETHMRQSPYNWFNFYPYWLPDEPTHGHENRMIRGA